VSVDTPGNLQGLTDLASRAIGGRVIHANDELFADRRHLIDPAPSAWEPGTYGRDGKIYDGWETRRRRDQPGHEGHDFAVLRLGAPGVVRHVIIDTAHFTGNYPPYASVEAVSVEGYPRLEELLELPWTTLVARSPLDGDTANGFDVGSPRRWTHLRLSIYPDGGVARFRALGVAVPDPRLLTGTIDLAAMQNGGTVLGASNMFYSPPANLIRPGDALTIAEGWETARRRGEGNEWVLFRLGAAGRPRVLEIDTTGYTGNAPGWARLRGIDARDHSLDDKGLDDEDAWVELLPRTGLLPDTLHRFRLREHSADKLPAPAVSHVRLDIYPDGGMGRVRLYGELDEAAARGAARRWLATLPPTHLLQVLATVPGLSEAEVARLTEGADVSAIESEPLPQPLRAYLLNG
jgi:allantoicase